MIMIMIVAVGMILTMKKMIMMIMMIMVMMVMVVMVTVDLKGNMMMIQAAWVETQPPLIALILAGKLILSI